MSEETKSTHKTKIDQEIVGSFLSSYYRSPISNLSFIGGGEGSQAFSFEAEGENFIVRVNKHSNSGFKKDRYAFLNFGSKIIPIPEIVDIGQINSGEFFAISKKVEGGMVRNLSNEEFNNTAQSFFKTLEEVHSVDIKTTKGYGKWNTEGVSEYTSWKDMLLDVDSHAKNMFENTFLEKDVWNQIYAKFVDLVDFCPEDRYLIHGDYSIDNVLAKNGKITGVVDWETSMYGDFLFDVAWLSFWSRGFDYEKSYLEFIKTIGKDIENFEERVLCYKLYIGLGSLSFYVYSNQQDKYDRSKEKLLVYVNN